MSSITQIKKTKNYKIDTEIIDFLNPDYIYIPVNNNVSIKIKNHQNVFKGSVILSNNNDYYYSSISGTVLGATKVKNYKNEELNAIVIENNFKEKLEKKVNAKKYINNYTEEELKDLIYKFNASKRNIEGKTLIINGIDMDPFEENYSYIIKKYFDKLLECIDAIQEILNVNKCLLAIKNNDSTNVDTLVNNIGTYPNINLKLMPDLYPIGKKEILIKKLTNEKMRKEGVIYFNIEEILAIYEVLKRKQPLCEKLVTISGDCIEEPIIINTKIGVLIKDLLNNENIKIKDTNYDIVVNGLLMGHEIDENCVLTNEIRSIFITKKLNIKESECINCGLCMNNCPMNINPKYMHENNNKKSKSYKEKCIHCGLCTYLCPSKINLLRSRNEK